MVKKLITLAAVCTVAAVPFAEAFAPQGPISSNRREKNKNIDQKAQGAILTVKI